MKFETVSFYRYLPIAAATKIRDFTTAGKAEHIAPNTVYPPSGHPKGFAFDWQRRGASSIHSRWSIFPVAGKNLNQNQISPHPLKPVIVSYSFLESGIVMRPPRKPAGMNIGSFLTAK
jgi:hypothetical protein